MRSLKLYLSLGSKHLATFQRDAVHELACLLDPVLHGEHDGADGASTTSGLRVAIGHTQKQSKDERLTIVSESKALTWHDAEPFDGNYDSIYLALIAAISQTVNSYNANS